MEQKDIFIIECPGCSARNRLKSYTADKLPVCAKCKTPLVDKNKNETHVRYGKMVDNFYKMPDPGLR